MHTMSPSRRPLRTLRHRLLLALWGAATCGAASAQSGDDTADGRGLRLSGFGTLGVTHVSGPDGWGFRRDGSQPETLGRTRADTDSRLGVQLNYSIDPRVEAVAQVLAKRRGPFDGPNVDFERAYVAFRPNGALTLRAGRLNVDAYLMSDYVNVGLAYLQVRPPVEAYALMPRSAEGLDAQQVWQLGDARWSVKGFVGRTFAGDGSFDSRTQLRPVAGLGMTRESDQLFLRASVSRAHAVNPSGVLTGLIAALKQMAALPIPGMAEQADALRNDLDLSGKAFYFGAVAARYEVGNWQWATEFIRSTGHPTVSFDTGFASLGRRFDSVTVYGSWSRVHATTPRRQAPAWAAQVTPRQGPLAGQLAQLTAESAAYAINWTRTDQTTLSLGARWEFHPQMALKGQWDWVRVGQDGGRLWAPAPTQPGRAQVLTLLVDFVF